MCSRIRKDATRSVPSQDVVEPHIFQRGNPKHDASCKVQAPQMIGHLIAPAIRAKTWQNNSRQHPQSNERLIPGSLTATQFLDPPPTPK